MNDTTGLLAIEGIDGSGKSTQVTAIVAALSRLGPTEQARVVPFGARSIYALAERLTGDPFAYHPAVPAELREFVFACDVAQYARIHISPALASGTTVVWDRGPLSYRSYARAFDGFSKWVEQVHLLYPSPRLTVVLDLPPEIAVERLRRRVEKPHQTDETPAVLERARALIMEEAAGRSDVLVLDARRDPTALTAQILARWQEIGDLSPTA